MVVQRQECSAQKKLENFIADVCAKKYTEPLQLVFKIVRGVATDESPILRT